MSEKVRRVERTLVVGPRGLPVLSGGYTEIDGIRIYDDQFVIGHCGLPEIRKGKVEPSHD